MLIIMCFILIIYPFLPYITYRIEEGSYATTYTHLKASFSSAHFSFPSPVLLMPQIGISAPIVEGSTQEALLHGAWHIPGTGSPFAGNMVLAGHRFAYLPPNNTTFYNLDKLKLHQYIFIGWDSQLFTYQISKIIVVPPTDIAIEEITPTPTLTLYTCTPLWSAADRLVIVAKEI